MQCDEKARAVSSHSQYLSAASMCGNTNLSNLSCPQHHTREKAPKEKFTCQKIGTKSLARGGDQPTTHGVFGDSYSPERRRPAAPRWTTSRRQTHPPLSRVLSSQPRFCPQCPPLRTLLKDPQGFQLRGWKIWAGRKTADHFLTQKALVSAYPIIAHF